MEGIEQQNGGQIRRENEEEQAENGRMKKLKEFCK